MSLSDDVRAKLNDDRLDRVLAACGHELWTECNNCGADCYGHITRCWACSSDDNALAQMLGDDRVYEHDCQEVSR